LRNIDDYAISCNNQEERLKSLLYIVDKLGHGGLVFVNTEKEAKELNTMLSEHLKCSLITSQIPKKEAEKTLQDFLKGEKMLLIGVAAPYGLLLEGWITPYTFDIRFSGKLPFSEYPLKT